MGDMPAWWDKDRQRQNTRSQKQEKDRAKEIGGVAQPGSGSSWRRPQDVVTADAMEQLKYTDKDSFTLKVSDWEQLAADALRAGKEPRMIVEMSKHNLRFLIIEEPL